MTWNRRIDGRTGTLEIKNNAQPEEPVKPQRVWLDTPRLADLDLVLTRLEDDGTESKIATSASTLDNVEHLYLPSLEPGRYRLTVKRLPDDFAEAWDYALAWYLKESGDVGSGDG